MENKASKTVEAVIGQVGQNYAVYAIVDGVRYLDGCSYTPRLRLARARREAVAAMTADQVRVAAARGLFNVVR